MNEPTTSVRVDELTRLREIEIEFTAYKTAHPRQLREKVGKLEDALSIVLLFHGDGYWSKEKGAKWKKITGRYSATTKAMCDHIRKLIKE